MTINNLGIPGLIRRQAEHQAANQKTHRRRKRAALAIAKAKIIELSR